MKKALTSLPQDLFINNIRTHIIGVSKKVKVLDGTEKQYIYFDNAASTPTFTFIRDAINELLEWYSGVHRGAGIKSLIATKAYDDSREIVAQFVNADLSRNTIIYGKNTTEAINKVAYRLNLTKDDVVICSFMEHHSNDLPWRKFATLVRIEINEDGTLNLNDLEEKLRKYKERIKLVAITGAANVTGLVNPIHEIAEMTHKVGMKILVDAAQLIPHRKIDLKPDDDIQHIDFLVFSAHKMYAPFGTGVLIGPKEIFEKGDPEYVGGGTIDLVTVDDVIWTHLPDKEEAGTPNLVGVVALAKAIQLLEKIGMENVKQHEIELTKYAYQKMSELPDVEFLGPQYFDSFENKLGVIPFNLKGFHHGLVAAVLCYEGAIGVRNGCFCAHPYIVKLLNVSAKEARKLREDILSGDRSKLPGAIRASFGIYNTKEEIDEFINVLKTIINREYKGKYIIDRKGGSYYPENFKVDYSKYFSLL